LIKVIISYRSTPDLNYLNFVIVILALGLGLCSVYTLTVITLPFIIHDLLAVFGIF